MKLTKTQSIPVHRMVDQTPLGIEFSYLEMTEDYDEIMIQSKKNVVHRDDYYLFLFIDTVEAVVAIDFEEIRVTEKSIFYVRPGQVHFVPLMRVAKGWYLAIDSMLVEKSYKNTFEGQFLTQRPIAIDTSVSERIGEAARMLHATMQEEPTVFSNIISISLANVFIGIIAEQYAGQQYNLEHRETRSALIAYQFKELLSENFKTVKSPTQYANMLNYSLSHLNESVKNITGFPVSYWIHQQVVLEAKRLLYYTGMDVKEIAFLLGYEDHTYFSRLFSKVVGIPPGAFRYRFRK